MGIPPVHLHWVRNTSINERSSKLVSAVVKRLKHNMAKIEKGSGSPCGRPPCGKDN